MQYALNMQYAGRWLPAKVLSCMWGKKAVESKKKKKLTLDYCCFEKNSLIKRGKYKN